jgi:hypothetical protein
MWLAATNPNTSIETTPWLKSFLIKLLEQNDEDVMNLIQKDLWKNSDTKPKYIRVDRYRYRFHKPTAGETDPPYWHREFLSRVYPRQGLATIDSLKELL